MKKYLLTALIFLIFTALTGEGPRLLTFQELSMPHQNLSPKMTSDSLPRNLVELHGQEVKVRGFLYKTPDDQWILASQPDLKSCCVGTNNMVSQQIYLKTDLLTNNTPSNVITLSGKFFINPIWNDKQELSQLYLLDNPLLIEHQSSRWLSYSAVIIAITLCLTFIARLFLKSQADKDAEE